jgi:hypothetical protein
MAGAYAVAGRCVRDWRDGCASAYRQFVLERLGRASERPRRAGACLRHQLPCHSRPHVPSSPRVSEALAKPSAVVASALVQSLRPVRPSGSDGQGPPSQAQSRRSLAPARQHSVFHVKQSTAELKGMRRMASRFDRCDAARLRPSASQPRATQSNRRGIHRDTTVRVLPTVACAAKASPVHPLPQFRRRIAKYVKAVGDGPIIGRPCDCDDPAE